MRIGSGMSGDDNVSEMTHSIAGAGSSGPFNSEDFYTQNQYSIGDSKILESQPRSARQSPAEASLMSPLHIPDEEALGITPIEPPASPLPTMLGLESRPLEDNLTPTRAGFGMRVLHIQDIDT